MERNVRKMKFFAPAQLKKKKAAAYARVSSGKDAMLHSLSAQVSYYNAYIQKRPDWEFVGIYADEALSGTKDGRDEFQRMIQDARDGKIDIIVTKSISRFARNTLTMLEVVRELKDFNVDVYFEKENIHSISGDGELMLSILASFAQEESRSVSENCKWRIRKSFEKGELINLRFMYGYDIIDGEIRINSEEAEIIRLIFKDYLSGIGATSIAKKLKSMKIDRPRGGNWNSERVIEILKNEKYAGNALLQKKFVVDHISKKLIRNHGHIPKYYAEGTHTAIIDQKTFDLAQAVLDGKRTLGISEKTLQTKYPFSSKIKCENCGKNYRRKIEKGKVVWYCSTYLKEGKKACSSRKIPEPVLVALSADALGLNEFDALLFEEQISEILVPESNKIIFIFRDGQLIQKEWEHKSRRESWTDEMRETARENELRRQSKWQPELE